MNEDSKLIPITIIGENIQSENRNFQQQKTIKVHPIQYIITIVFHLLAIICFISVYKKSGIDYSIIFFFISYMFIIFNVFSYRKIWLNTTWYQRMARICTFDYFNK